MLLQPSTSCPAESNGENGSTNPARIAMRRLMAIKNRPLGVQHDSGGEPRALNSRLPGSRR